MLRKSNVKIFFSSLFIFALLFTLFGIEIRAEEAEPNAGEKDTLRLAVWNIRRFGHIEQVRCDKQLNIIAKVIAQYDIVVIVEFMDEEIKVEDGKAVGLKEKSEQSDFLRLLDLLPNKEKYDHRISEKAGDGYQGNEYYAFLFNTDLVKVVKGKEGKMYEDKGEIYDDDKYDFTRDPYWITFRAGNFDFTVIAVHIYYGDTSKTALARRRKEIRALATVYKTVQDADPEEKDILLVGDFNLEPDDQSFKPSDESDKPSDESDDLWKNLPPLNLPPLFEVKYGHATTLSQKPKLYDNIFLEMEALSEYRKRCIDDFHVTYFNGVKRVAKRVSDHLPVTAEFRIDLEDDDPINSESTEQ